jgi:hypothetical protein
VYTVTNSGSTAYVIDGANDPALFLLRGFTYTFNVNASGHPFWIKTAQTTGTGDSYTSGVTNNGAQSGTITFSVPFNAPNTLYYICQFHSAMVGTITIGDVSPQGATGASGAAGVNGSTGATGVRGSTGVQGDQGATGIQGATGPAGATGAVGSSGATGAVTIVGNTYTVQTLYVSTLTVSTVGPTTVLSGNDLNLKASGQITVNAPFVLTTATTAQLASIGGITQRGAMVYVTDASGGAQPCYFNGTNWFTVNGRTQIA